MLNFLLFIYSKFLTSLAPAYVDMAQYRWFLSDWCPEFYVGVCILLFLFGSKKNMISSFCMISSCCLIFYDQFMINTKLRWSVYNSVNFHCSCFEIFSSWWRHARWNVGKLTGVTSYALITTLIVHCYECDLGHVYAFCYCRY